MKKRNSLSLSISKLIETELSLFPFAQAQDLLKLLYQAVYGPQHAVQSPDKLYQWLEKEISEIKEDPKDTPLFQPLTLHYPMGRLYLGPAIAKGHNIEKIHQAFLASCTEAVPPCPMSWSEIIIIAYFELKKRESHLSKSLLSEFNLLSHQTNGPFHHSAEYKKRYQPHYRLITQKSMQKWITIHQDFVKGLNNEKILYNENE